MIRSQMVFHVSIYKEEYVVGVILKMNNVVVVWGLTRPSNLICSYRQCKPDERSIYKTSPLFGQMYTVRKTGVMQVGDVVYKISR